MKLEAKCNSETPILSRSISKRKRTEEDDLISSFESPCPCTKKRYIESPTGVEKNACCDHSCLYKGMCVLCGENVNVSPHKLPDGSQSKSFSLDWIHDGIIVTSPTKMKELFDRDTLNLLENRKLRLVLDLDNTLVHVECVRLCDVEKLTIPESLMNKTPSSPSASSLDSVSTFDGTDALYEGLEEGLDAAQKEDEENVKLGNFNNYLQQVLSQEGEASDKRQEFRTFKIGNRLFIVHFRPGLIDFLREMCQFFEIYIYTHGTSLYALEVLNTILCNNENIFIPHMMGRGLKRKRTEKKLSKMLCARKASIVIDDQPNVWCSHDRRNVWSVTPFNPITGEKNDSVLFDLAISLRATHERYFSYAEVHHVFPDVRNFFDSGKKSI